MAANSKKKKTTKNDALSPFEKMVQKVVQAPKKDVQQAIKRDKKKKLN